MKFVSTGISISSINRIKELAEEKKFKEALEILDTQNLDKSINPQFLKISGEIFRENKRYYDSRRILLKAHQMAPQGNRIIHELIQLYLELGYFSKAQKYYEQYLFNTTPDDVQKDYVEYIMKKATGADVKDLAAILIPILERMPEDKWNFEAILLYHKMDRKDMALEESRYILENFKESEYVQPVIDYIDDKLDVDQWFYVYPKEEQPEDVDLYGDLIEQEEKLLEADYLRMFPPEARIMVEAEDNDAPEVAPVKEKKPRKIFNKKSKKHEENDDSLDNTSASEESGEDSSKQQEADNANTVTKEDVSVTKSENSSEATEQAVEEQEKSEAAEETNVGTEQSDTATEKVTLEKAESEEADVDAVSSEEQIQKEREAALDKILSKKIDKEKIKESAKQVAQAVKDIDTDKAKKQMKSVAETVKDNVKKATDVIGGAVGTKQVVDAIQAETVDAMVPDEELILDGIIEGVLEAPKKTVGQVVMNEELDALIPDSLEAMSEQEIADIEARKEEIERLELEALETSLKLEEEKKAKKLARKKSEDSQEQIVAQTEESDANESQEDSVATLSAVTEEVITPSDETTESVKENVANEDLTEKKQVDVIASDGSTYAELKNRFMAANEEEKPLESLGFISVVHSDVDAIMEDEIPDAAGMLRQMIDNKEFYSGEDSLGFESKASYENHGFEVEDCDFDAYRIQQEERKFFDEAPTQDDSVSEETPSVQVIFAEERVVAFEEVTSEDDSPMYSLYEEIEPQEVLVEENLTHEDVVEESAFQEEVIEEEPIIPEEVVIEEPIIPEEVVEEEPIIPEEAVEEEPIIPEEVIEEEPIIPEGVVIEEPIIQEEVIEEEPILYEEEVEEEPTFFEEEFVEDNVVLVVEESNTIRRNRLREDIMISSRMENLLLQLKESR